MAYFVNVPPVTCGNGLHSQVAVVDPVFHYVQSDGTNGVAALRDVKLWARSMHEDGVPVQEIVSDLYILNPNAREMIRCTLAVAEGSEAPELEVHSLDPLYGPVLYACKI